MMRVAYVTPVGATYLEAVTIKEADERAWFYRAVRDAETDADARELARLEVVKSENVIGNVIGRINERRAS
jgi:hypothetical protein